MYVYENTRSARRSSVKTGTMYCISTEVMDIVNATEVILLLAEEVPEATEWHIAW